MDLDHGMSLEVFPDALHCTAGTRCASPHARTHYVGESGGGGGVRTSLVSCTEPRAPSIFTRTCIGRQMRLFPALEGAHQRACPLAINLHVCDGEKADEV
eukprot:4437966-Prymnesium_polylepis.2